MKKATGALIVVVIALACAIAGVAALPGSTSRHSVHPRVGKVVATIPIPAGIGGFAIGEGAVWSTTDAVSTLTRIDPERNAVVARLKVERRNTCPMFPASCGDAAAGNGAVWVTHPSDNTVSRIDPQTNSVIATIPVGPHPVELAVSPGAVWVSDDGGPSVSRIDPATNHVVATIRLGPASACCAGHMGVTAGGGAVWVGVANMNTVVRIDPATNAVAARIRLSGQPYGGLAADEYAVWAASAHAGSVIWRIDPHSNRRTGTVRGELMAPIGLALGFGSLWVADLDAKTIDRVNPRNGRIVARLRVGGYPIRLGIGFGSVWVRDDTGRVLRITPQR
jgi:virginiamycin B lyase